LSKELKGFCDPPMSFIKQLGAPQDLGESYTCCCALVQPVGCVSKAHDLFGEIAAVEDCSRTRKEFCLDRSNRQKRALIVRGRVCSSYTNPVLSVLHTSLAIQDFSELGRPHGKVAPIVDALQKLTLLAQAPLGAKEIFSKKFDVRSHRAAEDDRNGRRAEFVVDLFRFCDELATLRESPELRLEPTEVWEDRRTT
jgi:hypothetical protein